MMKMCISAMIGFAVALCNGMPSTNSFVAVTNDWYNANFTNVYELAQQRMANNSNDVVAAYLMLEWNMSFAPVADICYNLRYLRMEVNVVEWFNQKEEN